MPPLKILHRFASLPLTFCSLIFTLPSSATDFEIMATGGYTLSAELDGGDSSSTLTTTDEPNLGLAFSWQDSPKGQGQVLVNYISRHFTDQVNQSTSSFDTIYTHFNGVAFFTEKGYTTTVGLGIGATYFDSDFDEVIYPSLTASIGTRYEFSDNLAFITELRAYATLVKDNDTLFCEQDSCLAQFNGALWFDNQLSVGLAYSF